MITKIFRKLKRRIEVPVDKYLAGKGWTKPHHYSKFSIDLPRDHLLPVLQKNAPRYDRFLPHLASHLGSSGTVIDVGANVGDTVAAMAERNAALDYICVEGDDRFFEALTANIAKITSALDVSITPVKALIGKDIKNIVLEGVGGTKQGVINAESGIRTQELDSIVAPSLRSKVVLLKSDVDGFDYDIINSASAILMEHKPLCFFECQYFHDWQKEGFMALFNSLMALGYSRFDLFDNFGDLMLTIDNRAQFGQLIDYIWRQNAGHSVRTIYYYDILASMPDKGALVDEILASYY